MSDVSFMEEILDLQEMISDADGEDRDKIKLQAQQYKDKLLNSLT